MYDVEKMLAEGRTIFPVVDHNGQVVGAVGRNLKLSPKYKAVGKGFVGNILTEEKDIVLTEGIIDALLAEKLGNDIVVHGVAGKDNVIGVVGEVTNDAIQAFIERRKKVILFFDQDELGRASAEKLFKRMKEAGADVHVFKTDSAKDFPEYLAIGHAVSDIINAIMFGGIRFE
jgi:DNA primase